MAIKILITLEGSEQVKAALDDLSKSGEQFMAGFKDLGTAKGPLQDFSVNLESAKPSLDSARDATQGFREAVHILHPILRAAGLEIGNLGSFARVASAGIAGLTAAITGAVIVGLATLEEQAKKTKGALEDLFGSKALGGQAFANIEQAAHTLSTSVENLAPAFESLTTAWQRFVQTTQQFKFVAPPGIDLPPALAGNVTNLTTAFTNFIKILRAGRLDETEAEKAAKSLFDTLKNGGQLTADALKQLPVGTIQLLAEAMGRGTISAEQFIAEVGLAPIPMNKLLEAVQRFGPQADRAFEDKAVKSFRDSMNDALNAIQKAFKDISGFTFSGALQAFFAQLTKAIQDNVAELNRWIELLKRLEGATEIPGLGRLVQNLREAFSGQRGQGAFGGTTEQINQIWSALQPPADLPANFKKVGDAFSGAFKAVPDSANQAKTEVDQVIANVTNLVPAISDIGTEIVANSTATKGQVDDIWRQNIINQNAIQSAGESAKTLGQTARDNIAATLEVPPDLSSWQSAFQAAFDAATNLAQSTYSQIAAIFANPITLNFTTSGFTAPGGAPFASGGLVRGPGTSTSDSILARLSNREFVVNAKAVAFYGADLLAALNSLRLPRNFFEGFNMGGLVESMVRNIPHFAEGGQVGSSPQLAPVTIVLGGQKFGLAGNSDTIKALSRFAVNSRLSSGGRKPSWVGSK